MHKFKCPICCESIDINSNCDIRIFHCPHCKDKVDIPGDIVSEIQQIKKKQDEESKKKLIKVAKITAYCIGVIILVIVVVISSVKIKNNQTEKKLLASIDEIAKKYASQSETSPVCTETENEITPSKIYDLKPCDMIKLFNSVNISQERTEYAYKGSPEVYYNKTEERYEGHLKYTKTLKTKLLNCKCEPIYLVLPKNWNKIDKESFLASKSKYIESVSSLREKSYKQFPKVAWKDTKEETVDIWPFWNKKTNEWDTSKIEWKANVGNGNKDVIYTSPVETPQEVFGKPKVVDRSSLVRHEDGWATKEDKLIMDNLQKDLVLYDGKWMTKDEKENIEQLSNIQKAFDEFEITDNYLKTLSNFKNVVESNPKAKNWDYFKGLIVSPDTPSLNLRVLNAEYEELPFRLVGVKKNGDDKKDWEINIQYSDSKSVKPHSLNPLKRMINIGACSYMITDVEELPNNIFELTFKVKDSENAIKLKQNEKLTSLEYVEFIKLRTSSSESFRFKARKGEDTTKNEFTLCDYNQTENTATLRWCVNTKLYLILPARTLKHEESKMQENLTSTQKAVSEKDTGTEIKPFKRR